MSLFSFRIQCLVTGNSDCLPLTSMVVEVIGFTLVLTGTGESSNCLDWDWVSLKLECTYSHLFCQLFDLATLSCGYMAWFVCTEKDLKTVFLNFEVFRPVGHVMAWKPMKPCVWITSLSRITFPCASVKTHRLPGNVVFLLHLGRLKGPRTDNVGFTICFDDNYSGLQSRLAK